MDYDFVTERLATGAGIVTEPDLDSLVNSGIGAIIDCRIEVDDSILIASSPYAHQLLYLWNGVADDGVHGASKIAWLQRSMEFALQLLKQPHIKIYAHCAAGINRGPSTVYAILRAFGITDGMSRAMIYKARPQTVIGIAYAPDAELAVAQGWSWASLHP